MQIHKEICALLLGALESLKLTLAEFSTVLPHQWAALMGVSSQTLLSPGDSNQRLKKLVELAKVGCLFVNLFTPKNFKDQ